MEALMVNLLAFLGVEAFQTPAWLWALLGIPLLWWLAWKTKSEDDWAQFSRGQALRVKHSLVDLHPTHSPDTSRTREKGWWVWQQTMRSVVLLLIFLALAEPVKKSDTPLDLPPVTQRDLVFVLESSASFVLPDYQQNGQQITRMDAVKTVLQQFLSGLAGNRFGVVIYGEQAFSLLPLTSDLTAAQISLQRLVPYLAGRTDEAMVEALGVAMQQTQRLVPTPRNAPDAQQPSQVEKRAVILISDGLSAKSPYSLDEAINLAKQQGIPIYTIGVGAKDASADKRQFQGLIYQPLESESLQTLAEQTGGSYFHVGGTGELQTVLKQIDRLEGIAVPAAQVTQSFIPLMPIFMHAALWMLLLYGGVMILKAWFRVQPNRPVTSQELIDD